MARLELIEIRALDGANVFLPRPAIKLHLRADRALPATVVERARGYCREWLPGAPETWGAGPADDLGAALLWPLARAWHAALALPDPEGGVGFPAALSRPDGDDDAVVIAYAWDWRTCAEGIARSTVELAEAALAGRPFPVEATVAALRQALARDREADDRPRFLRDADRRLPIASVTGTNGKTSTTRCLAHILTVAGRRVGMANSSGVWIGGEQVQEGDYTGPAGARRVLEDERTDVAVLETARGGILLRGIGYESNDVGVVTNVSADHLGLQGVDTVEGLAEVKSLVVRLTRPEGHAVLNADNALTRAMAGQARAPVTFFSRRPGGDTVRAHLAAGGRAVLAREGRIVLAAGTQCTDIIALADVPMTFGGHAPQMVENALAATAAALGLGLSAEEVARGLASFRNSPEQNPGRLNVFALRDPAGTVIMDYAHNEAGLEQLLAFAQHFRGAGGRLFAIIGTAGDRPDAILRGIGRLAGERSDLVWIKGTARYLRGRTLEEMNAAFVAGVEAGGGTCESYTVVPDELTALTEALAAARAGDVIAMMCLEQQAEALALLAGRGEPLAH